MVKLSPGGRTQLRNGDIHVSKPAVIRALQSLNLPQDLAEKLNHIGKSRKQSWAIQSGKLLIALSVPSSTFMSAVRSSSDQFRKVVDARYDNLMMGRAVSNQGEFSASFLDVIDRQTSDVLMQLTNFEVS